MENKDYLGICSICGRPQTKIGKSFTTTDECMCYTDIQGNRPPVIKWSNESIMDDD